MGYQTEFNGVIKVEPPLSPEEINYLNMFSDSRRMNREKGPYYVRDDNESDVINPNRPPKCQPNLWCQWISTEDGSGIEWDGSEKFYDAAEWMQYLIDHFFGEDPIAKKVDSEAGEFLQSHKFSGTINAEGEERDDVWRIRIENDYQVVVDTAVFDVKLSKSKNVTRHIQGRLA